MFFSRVCCVGIYLCDELITHSAESYRVFVCVYVIIIVFYLEMSAMGGLRPRWTARPQKESVTWKFSVVLC